MRIIDEAVLDEFRFTERCEWCGKRFPGIRMHPHHVHSRGAGRLDVRINLIALCPALVANNCHGDVHAGAITRFDLLAVVAVREGLMQGKIEEVVWELRRWDKGKPLPDRLKKYLRREAA